MGMVRSFIFETLGDHQAACVGVIAMQLGHCYMADVRSPLARGVLRRTNKFACLIDRP